MKQCLTKAMMRDQVSSCLVEMPACGFAHKLGFSYLCLHPDHAQFRARVGDALTPSERHELYEALKRKRRNEFLADLDEEQRAYFCRKIDFFGSPVTDGNQPKNGC